jgi:ornithine cyclodeaminase
VRVVSAREIRAALEGLDLIPAIEAGFVAYSEDRATVPPVGELQLDRGEVHIKYGYLDGGEHYVIKIASGFYGNPSLGLPSGHGLMLLFRQETGEPVCLLDDGGWLTDVRTAVAGAIAAKHLAPATVERIGIYGTGVQARLQLLHLRPIVDCRRVLVWGRRQAALTSYREEMAGAGFEVETTTDPTLPAGRCQLVVTTTPSTEPLFAAGDLASGAHVTAVGSDTPEKQELDPGILARADRLVADSLPQCRLRGEIHRALEAGRIEESAVVELGEVIAGRAAGRTSAEQLTVADLTGVAVQDIQIAEAVYRRL